MSRTLTRSLGRALFAGGPALDHVWLFLIAPLVGGAIAAVRLLSPAALTPVAVLEAERDVVIDETGVQVPGQPAPGHAEGDARFG